MKKSFFPFSSIPAKSVLLLVMALLTGCASHSPPSYYSLKPAAEAEQLTTPHSIGIQPVVMPSWLDQHKISWNDGDVNMVVLEQERWAGPLSQIINETMLRNFSRIYPDAFVSLGPWARSGTPERVISTRIVALERADNQLSTEVAIIISDQQRKVLYNRFRVYRQPLADNSPVSEFAEALGMLLGKMNTDIASQIGRN